MLPTSRWMRTTVALLLLQAAASLPVLAQAGNKLALIIGNGAYAAPVPALKNPVNDARDMDRALKALGFRTFVEYDATGAKMFDAFGQF